MKYKLKNEKGITLIALGITIIVLLILASITITASTEAIKKANVEALKTNMLLIQAKAKEYMENAVFELGTKPEEASQGMKDKAEAELAGSSDLGSESIAEADESIKNQLGLTDNVYQLSTANLEKMGIKDVKSDSENGYYVIAYDMENYTVEIYNTDGYDGKYSLTDIEKIEI